MIPTPMELSDRRKQDDKEQHPRFVEIVDN